MLQLNVLSAIVNDNMVNLINWAHSGIWKGSDWTKRLRMC